MSPLLPRTPRARGALFAATVAMAVAAGPVVRFQERWSEPDLPGDLDAWLAEGEAGVPDLRPGDGKEIVWVDSATRQPTPLSLVYLHGFSADRHEIEPVMTQVAAELGANLLFARLTGHGRDGPAMAEATVESWMDDTAEAFAVGRRIGGRVVLVGTSTGGTLATWAATRPETAPGLAALVLVSPNFQPRDRTSRLLLYPWGGLVARAVVGPERCFQPLNEGQARHWTTCYPTSALPVMMALAEHVRTLDLSGLEVPTLVLYHPEDRVVDSEETLRVMDGMGGGRVTLRVVETTSAPDRHVLAGDIVSPASNTEVAGALVSFLQGLPGGG